MLQCNSASAITMDAFSACAKLSAAVEPTNGSKANSNAVGHQQLLHDFPSDEFKCKNLLSTNSFISPA